MQSKKFTLSMKLRADSVLQKSTNSPEKSPPYVHNYSLPKIEHGWTAALRAHEEKEERMRRMKAHRSETQVSHIYERLSGLHATEVNLGQFPDRGQIIHPSVLCARCSDPAAVCVPCAEQLIQDGISVYINSRAQGATYLFHNAISRSASSTVLRFVVFKIWSNSMYIRRVMRQRRIVDSKRRLFRKLCFLPFRSWQRYISDVVKEKKDRKTLKLENRIKQLEEQLLKLSGEHKELNAQHSITCSELVEERALSEERRLRIIALEDRVALDEKKVFFLSGFMAPLLQISSALNELYQGHSEKIGRMKPTTSYLKLISPPKPLKTTLSSHHYDLLMKWVNNTAFSISPNVAVRGIIPEHYLPMAPPAESVESLSDGKLFSCAVAALILNSDAMHFVEIPSVRPSETAWLGLDVVAETDTVIKPEELSVGAHAPEEESTVNLEEEAIASSPVTAAPILYDVDESTPERAAIVTAYLKFLSDINNNRASPHDLITLSMAAAGNFLQIPADDLEESLSLDSITCILYRISYLRMFTASIHGYDVTMLPEDLSALAKLREVAVASKIKQEAVVSEIEKIAVFYRDATASTSVGVDVASDRIALSEDFEHGAVLQITESKNDNYKIELDNEGIGNIGEVQGDTLLGLSSLTDFVSPVDINVEKTREEYQSENVIDELAVRSDPVELLHQQIADIVNMEAPERLTADFMVHLNVALDGLKTMLSLVDARKSVLDQQALTTIYTQAANHGFIAQKTFNYLQF